MADRYVSSEEGEKKNRSMEGPGQTPRPASVFSEGKGCNFSTLLICLWEHVIAIGVLFCIERKSYYLYSEEPSPKAEELIYFMQFFWLKRAFFKRHRCLAGKLSSGSNSVEVIFFIDATFLSSCILLDINLLSLS